MYISISEHVALLFYKILFFFFHSNKNSSRS